MTRAIAVAAALAGMLFAGTAFAVNYPVPQVGDWTAQNFTFHTGEVMPALHLHYTTVGNPKGEPVLILHGTGGAGTNFLSTGFANEMFGPGQPLDATKYYIILPDAIGSGQSSKPSDGLKTTFPKYDYADMVAAEYLLLTQGLGIQHVRLVMGNSMGGMETWIWGEKYPAFMDALVPLASTPGEMAGRNWMLRRMMVATVTNDPAYDNGNYTTEPASLKYASALFGIATSGGTLGYQSLAPTHALADKLVNQALASLGPADANDFVYQWESSADYNPTPDLGKIQAPLLAINSADDERNPPETGIMVNALKSMPHAQLYLIPASADTRGHATVGTANFWKQPFQDFMQSVPDPAAAGTLSGHS